MSLSRRDFIGRVVAAGLAGGSVNNLNRYQSADRAHGTFEGTVALSRRGAVPVDTLLGAGLDARLFTDLSTLTPDTLITAAERFYIRTAHPPVALTSDWSIALGGLARPTMLPMADLRPLVRPMGVCLLECSGNGDPDNFGLMSAAIWNGVPLQMVLERVSIEPRATRVLVAGADFTSPTETSLPGSSWIFSRTDLEDAFLATHMNGEPLPLDHGAPVRLIVPGWYGCTCIKWVNKIEMVDDNAAASLHMREFAARTHQRGVPTLARDFQPAVMDHAAFPIRVEKWRIGNRLVYRIVGILWGGRRPSRALQIRFRSDLPFEPVDHVPDAPSTRTWNLWSHDWYPDAPGQYAITLRMADTSLQTRRLDIGFYRRTVTIDEI